MIEQEIERKWLVTPSEYNMLLHKHNVTRTVIQQRYFRKHECYYHDGAFYALTCGELSNWRRIPAPHSCPDLAGVNLHKLGARVRFSTSSEGPKGEFTVKLKNEDGSNGEVNIPLDMRTVNDFITNLDATKTNANGMIHKIRWSYDVGNVHFDADRFINRPYYIVEAEFKTIEDALQFSPDFDYIREVTDEKEYSNKYMSFNFSEADQLRNRIREISSYASQNAEDLQNSEVDYTSEEVYDNVLLIML